MAFWLRPTNRLRQSARRAIAYYPVNIGYIHTFHPSRHNVIQLRFDVLNVFDEVYQIRSGTGIGVAAPQYGQRRTFYTGLAYQF